jgi:hypothetical protein
VIEVPLIPAQANGALRGSKADGRSSCPLAASTQLAVRPSRTCWHRSSIRPPWRFAEDIIAGRGGGRGILALRASFRCQIFMSQCGILSTLSILKGTPISIQCPPNIKKRGGRNGSCR